MTEILSREKYLGGADVAAILGLSPYETPVDVFMRKKGLAPPRDLTPEMEWGNRLEPVVASWYADRYSLDLIKGEQTIHPVFPFIAGTPDYIANVGGEPTIIEIKTTGEYNRKLWGDSLSDQMPDAVICQIALYMHLKDFNQAVVPVSIERAEPRLYTMKRDEELEGKIIAAMCEFKQMYLDTDTCPPLQTAGDYAVWVKAKYGNQTSDLMLDAQDDEVIRLLEEAYHMHSSSKMIEKSYEELKMRFKAIIGEHAGIQSSAYIATNKQSKGTAKPDWESIAKAMNPPIELIQKHTREVVGSRRFLISERKVQRGTRR